MRIRSITPSFYDDDKTTGVWPVDQKFVYLGLISVADDWGRMEWRPRKIRAAIFPYEEGGLVSAAGPAVDFGACCRAIAAAGRLRLYSVNGQEYACLPTFRAHQHPSRPTPSRIPAPPSAVDNLPLSESSVSAHGAPTQESSGEERRVEEAAHGVPHESAPTKAPEQLPLTEMSSERPGDEVLLWFPCKRGKRNSTESWPLVASNASRLARDYPGVNIVREAEKALAWVRANKPKTADGMDLFLRSWLDRVTAAPNFAAGNGTDEYAALERAAAEERKRARPPTMPTGLWLPGPAPAAEPSGDIGRGIRSTGQDEADPDRLRADGVDLQTAGGNAVDPGRTTGNVQDRPSVGADPPCE